MTVEIKAIDNRVLYTAKSATDIRTALVEAVLRRTDLGSAYLRGADLGGANLGSAYLRGANLGSAYLGGAYLGDADLAGAYLGSAYLRGADLGGANLGSAYLRGADLGDADLRGADLRGADLAGADLRGAYLRDAKGLNPYMTTPLHMLRDQPGTIRAYKLVTADGVGPFNGGVTYTVGESVEITDADTDPTTACAAGINVATLDWCISRWQAGYRILLVEFTTGDIAAIPHGSDGKFRLHRCTVVGEKDLAEIGLIVNDDASEPVR